MVKKDERIMFSKDIGKKLRKGNVKKLRKGNGKKTTFRASPRELNRQNN